VDVATRAGLVLLCSAAMSVRLAACSSAKSVSAMKLSQQALPGRDRPMRL
jgi:hypothetical protein